MSLLSFNITKVAKDLQNGSISATELCKACLERAQLISKLNAFVLITKDKALKQASAAGDRYKSRKCRGSLDGIPVAVKDNFCTDGVVTSCGSRMLTDFMPAYNATVVARLEQAGAVLLGKSNLDEFAMGSGTVDSVHGATRNIWGSELGYSVGGKMTAIRSPALGWRVAGGSSGGSAVAVATRACFAALGSDTGGSTRNPASYCGIVGFKPSYGRLSRHGLVPLVNSMDTPGILARTVQDAGYIFNAIAGHDPHDSTSIKDPFIAVDLSTTPLNISSLRVGIPQEYHCHGLSAEVLAVWSRTADMLEEAGATVMQMSLPHTCLSIACYSVLNQCEVASNMARYDGLKYGHRADTKLSTEQLYAETRSEAFNDVVRSRILAGNYFLLKRNYERYFVQALRVRRLIAEDFARAWQHVDVLLTPTTLTPPPLLSAFTWQDNRTQCAQQDFCTQPANMAGCPAVTIPISLSEEGLPLSLQLMSPNLSEQTLLSVANWIETNTMFPQLDLVEEV